MEDIVRQAVVFLKQNGSLILSGLSLVVAIISLVKSSAAQKLQNKINALELEIKENEIDKITKEKEACIEARVISLGDGKHRLKLWNSGNATAYKISAKFEDDPHIIIVNMEKFPYDELEARKSFELVLIVHSGSMAKFKITTTWTDGDGVVHEKTQMGDL